MADRRPIVLDGGQFQELPGSDTLQGVEPRFRAINLQSDDYTLAAGDEIKQILMTKATATTLTVPPAADEPIAVGAVIAVTQYGAGQVTIAAGEGVTIRSAESLKLAKQYASATLRKIAADEWLLDGYLELA